MRQILGKKILTVSPSLLSINIKFPSDDNFPFQRRNKGVYSFVAASGLNQKALIESFSSRAPRPWDDRACARQFGANEVARIFSYSSRNLAINFCRRTWSPARIYDFSPLERVLSNERQRRTPSLLRFLRPSFAISPGESSCLSRSVLLAPKPLNHLP